MAKKAFDVPVRIVTEDGQAREIASPYEAYTFLASRKVKRLDLSDALLRRTFSAASMGLVKASVARAALVRYATKKGILAPDETMPAVDAGAAPAGPLPA